MSTPGPRYRLEPADLHGHRWRVTLTLPAPAPRQRLWLPAWIPGSYLIREFARHLDGLQARQRGRPVPLEALDKTTWVATADGRAPLVVRYEVYAADPSVRGAWLDAERGFFNGSSLFLAADGRTGEPHRLQIGRLPRGWQVATAMRELGRRRYEAADYHELIDHPFELGRFWHGAFRAGGVLHRMAVSGAWPGFDGAQLLAATARVCEGHIRLWHGRGRPPFDRYLFLLHAADDTYGGLEHRASCALGTARRDLPRAGTAAHDAGWLRLLGLVSHEYFHAWNVKRLMPRELAAPDLRREAPTRLLWWFEGVTTYIDDLMLRRTGLVDAPTYLGLLAAHVNAVAATPGRQRQSVAEASFDAWTRLYRPDENTANSTVSYYAKGALVALCLDLCLRREGGGSLDAVLRRLWRSHRSRPLAEADIADALAAVAGRPLRAELDAWIHGRDELPLATLLAGVGVVLEPEPADLAASLGLKLAEGPISGVQVKAVLRGSAAERAGVAAGDELLAADGWRVRRLDDARAWLAPGRPFELLVVRDQRLRPLRVTPPAAPARAAWRLRLQAQPDAAARERQRAWLGD